MVFISFCHEHKSLFWYLYIYLVVLGFIHFVWVTLLIKGETALEYTVYTMQYIRIKLIQYLHGAKVPITMEVLRVIQK